MAGEDGTQGQDGTDFEDLGYVPGEIIVTLSSSANATASATLSTAGTESETGDTTAATSLGVPAIDQVLAALQPQSITKLFDGDTTTVATADTGDGSGGGSGDTGGSTLEASYLVSVSAETDLNAAISQLTALPEVVDAEPNYYVSSTFVPNDTDWAQQWGPVKIHCPEAWDTATGSPSVIVAIVDSGVDLNHPDLAPQLLPGTNVVNVRNSPPPPGRTWVGRLTPDNNPQDEVGHGTHVAGIVGALGNNGVGVAGVVWQCKLLPVRVMARTVKTSNGAVGGNGTSDDIAKGIHWAADNGAKIINLSLGGYGNSRIQAREVAYAQSRGVIVIAAMGNDNTSRPMYPAALPGVVAVGSIGQTDQRSSFSNTGSHMAICAPGEAIHSTYFDYPTSNSTYADLSGTSMATPHVSGVAALAWSADTTRSAADIKAALLSSARAMPVADPTQYGAGCVDANGALHVIAPAPTVISGPDPESTPVPDNPTQVASNDPASTTPSDGTMPSDTPVTDPAQVDPSLQPTGGDGQPV